MLQHPVSFCNYPWAVIVEGIEIELSEVDVAPGGLLTYKGEQIILYIKYTNKSEEINLYYPEESTRFRLADCQTL